MTSSPDERLSLAEASIELGVSPSTLQRMKAKQEIGYGTIGRGPRPKLYFTRKHIEDYLAAHTFEPVQQKPRRKQRAAS
jgi:hypothetical protein